MQREGSFYTCSGIDAEFFDSALNDRQADDASIGITPNCLAEEADRLRKQLLLASGDDLAVCHSPRPAVQHIRITPPLRGVAEAEPAF